MAPKGKMVCTNAKTEHFNKSLFPKATTEKEKRDTYSVREKKLHTKLN